ncbi:hypothetical protein ABEW34_20815 [Paenibacillus algorifonticola]|uniref:LiaF transmembrane domain-containing protein n=1 Tax=Paenibacillus algorifonticola TaxID=684063 RepID=UPI003D2C34A1
MANQKLLGVILAIVGSFIVLKFLGVHLGGLIGFLFPFILIGLGVLGWSNNKKWIGGILITIGALGVFSKFSGLILLVLAVGLVVYGVSLLRKSSYRGY